MKVGIVQTNPEFGQVTQNIEKAVTGISQHEADLWVLPELFNTGYQFKSKEETAALAEEIPGGPTTQRLIEFAKEKKTAIVAGLAERAGDKVYNASILVNRTGEVFVYRKIHLFYEEKLYFTPGDLPFSVHSVEYRASNNQVLKAKIGMMICFDWIFPESARSLALLGADIICHPANLVLPHCPDAMPVRCLENRVFAITANRIGSETRTKETLRFIGKSQIVDPRGKILFRASDTQEAVQVLKVNPKEARDKQLNPYNPLLDDRRESFYLGLPSV